MEATVLKKVVLCMSVCNTSISLNSRANTAVLEQDNNRTKASLIHISNIALLKEPSADDNLKKEFRCILYKALLAVFTTPAVKSDKITDAT
jgi:hypothetical protein